MQALENASTRTSAREPELRLERRSDGRLWAVHGARASAVRTVRCFPWSAPARLISLRNDDDEEVAFMIDPHGLDSESRTALELSLAEAGFILEITAVKAIEEDFEMRCWSVRTAQGSRTFQTALDAWPRRAPGGGLLIEDVGGDLFWIRDATRLDTASRKLLWAYVD